MDRHTCKLCFRRFSNGKALGGHMRSHVASANMAAMKAQLQDLSPSPSSSSSASHCEQEAAEHEVEVANQEAAAAVEAGLGGGGEAKQLAYYGLRENPRKSYRLVDPVFSSTFAAADYGAGAGVDSSIVLQDRESETESSKPPPLRRRSSRRRRWPAPQLPPPRPEPSLEPEPVSSVSDTTPEEDVARCLMMLSRDVWTTTDSSTAAAKRRRKTHRGEMAWGEKEEQQLDDGSEEKRVAVVRSRRGGRKRYQCGTCGKVFRSYQALGGHRASHKNARACAAAPSPVRFSTNAHVEAAFEEEREKEEYEHGDCHLGHQIHDADSEVNAFQPALSADRRFHECPVCFRVFGSGQALGGHKRSHLAYSSSSTNPSLLLRSHAATATSDVAAATAAAGASPVGTTFTKKFAGESLIDLNLPAPMDEEPEMSAVFDAEQ